MFKILILSAAVWAQVPIFGGDRIPLHKPPPPAQDSTEAQGPERGVASTIDSENEQKKKSQSIDQTSLELPAPTKKQAKARQADVERIANQYLHPETATDKGANETGATK